MLISFPSKALGAFTNNFALLPSINVKSDIAPEGYRTAFFQGAAGNMNGSIGLIAFLGKCTIQDFGIHNGTIETQAAAKPGSLSTFGCVYTNTPETAPTFTRVWSGVTLSAKGASSTPKMPHLNALAGSYNSTACSVKVNGFVFTGVMNKRAGGADAAYGVYGGHTSGPADNSTFFNIISYPTVYTDIHSYLFGFSSDSTFTAAVQANNIKNVYGFKKTEHTNTVGIVSDYRNTIRSITTSGGNLDGVIANPTYLTTVDIKEAAWNANKTTYNPNNQPADAVYFTLDNQSNVRPTGTQANRIVQYTYDVKDSEDDEVVYANAGTNVDVKGLFSTIGADANIKVTVGGDEVEVKDNGRYPITDDAVITIKEVNHDDLLAAKTKLEKLDPQYLSNSDDLNSIINNLETIINKAGATNAEKQDAIDAANGFTPLLYGEDNYEKLPGYKDFEDYEAYNTGKHWAIREAADWLKMVEVSNPSETNTEPKDFADHTFHVLDNIDFADDDNPNGILMDPLNYGDGKINDGALFQGTIKGYNHSFKNVNISKTVNGTYEGETLKGEFVVGLIAKLGNGASISDFGVDSGTISIGQGETPAKTVYAATFGRARGTTAPPQLKNVWSGATLVATNTNSAIAVGIVGPGANSKITINGAYFYGKATAKYVYGIYHSLHSETIKNVLSAPTIEGDVSENFMYAKHSTPTTYSVLNNFSVGSPIYDGYDPAAEGDAADAKVVNSKTVASALEGAWKINDAQASLEEEADKVYFNLTKDGDIRPFGTETDRIVKFEGAINKDSNNPKSENQYANTGTVDVKKLFNLTAIDDENLEIIVTPKEGGDPLTQKEGTTFTYEITGDVTVEISYGATPEQINAAYTVLQQALAQYDALTNEMLEAHFKVGNELKPGNIDLATFRSDLEAAKTAGDLDTLIELQGKINDNKLQVEVSTKPEKAPAFKEHETYIDYNVDKNWLIEDPADWEAMNQIALKLELDENGDPTEEYSKYINTQQRYFLGFTFHLTDDVDFSATKDAPILPLGARNESANKIRKFSGTINGNGYGFKDINIVVKEEHIGDGKLYYPDGTMSGSVGLIAFIGKDAQFIDFGIHSGTIIAETGGNAGSVSSFGSIATDSDDVVATFTRVWSGATLQCKEKARKNVYLNALAGLINTVSRKIKVNGFVFSGEMGKQKGGSDLAYGIAGGNRNGIKGSEFSNIVTYPTVSAGIKTYLFSVRPDPETGEITMPTISNVYGVKKNDDTKKAGIQYDYRETNPLDGGDVGYKENGDEENFNSKTLEETCLTANSGKHAAWMSNTKQTAGDANAVYFTIKEGEIRPVASADERIVQVIVNGNEGYANRGSMLSKTTLAKKAHVSETEVITKITINGQEMPTDFAEYTLAENTTTIEIETECIHEGIPETRPIASEEGKKHAPICTLCNSAVGPAVDCTLTKTEIAVDFATGTSSHAVTCSICKRNETEVCNGTQEKNTADCTENDIWSFDCGVHKGTYYVSEAPGNDDHDFTNAEWKNVEGTNKQYMQCNICDTKLYQIRGEVTVTGIKLAPGDQGNVDITLPEEVASATLEFNLPTGFTVVKVNGEAHSGNAYSVTNYNKTPLVVTIEAADNVTAGGSFVVTMTDAKASVGSAVIADPAQAIITVNGNRGDANDDGDVNLQDALAVLQQIAGKNPPTCILLNADMNANDKFDINDVKLIVDYWAKETINNLKK